MNEKRIILKEPPILFNNPQRKRCQWQVTKWTRVYNETSVVPKLGFACEQLRAAGIPYITVYRQTAMYDNRVAVFRAGEEPKPMTTIKKEGEE